MRKHKNKTQNYFLWAAALEPACSKPSAYMYLIGINDIPIEYSQTLFFFKKLFFTYFSLIFHLFFTLYFLLVFGIDVALMLSLFYFFPHSIFLEPVTSLYLLLLFHHIIPFTHPTFLTPQYIYTLSFVIL